MSLIRSLGNASIDPPLTPAAATALVRRASSAYLRGRLFNTLNGVPLGNGAAASNTYRKAYTMGPGGGTDIRVYFDNWFVSSGAGETSNPGTVTFKCAIEYSGVSYPVYFPTGTRSITLDSGGRIESLPTGIEIPAGATFYVRTYTTQTTNALLSAFSCIPGSGDSTTFGSDVADNTGGLNNTTDGSNIIAPTVITGTALVDTGTRQILVWGDSRANGSSGDPVRNRGLIRYALPASLPGIFIGRGGEQASSAAPLAGHARRTAYIASCEYMIEMYDTNDVSAGRTLAQLQADLLTLWTAGSARGLKVYTCTSGPNTSSTDGWLTTAAQTKAFTAPKETVRTGINDWRRGGSPIDPTTKTAVAVGTSGALLAGQAGHPLSGYFEVADLVETTRNSGIWKADGRTVTGLSVTTGTTTLTSSGGFVPTDTSVNVPGAGASAAALLTSATYVDANTMTLGTAAGTTVSAVSGSVGPDPYTGDGLHPGSGVTALKSSRGVIAAAAGIDTTVFV